MEDTIAAISTALGPGGIAIVRMTGPRSLAVADAIFMSRPDKPSAFKSHTLQFGSIGNNGDLVDQVMMAVMHPPRTYTGELTVEINCHGGTLPARKVLAACLQNGARLAEPGEFTKRAFLNGKIDLTQAEAVMDVIAAKTDRAHAAALQAMEGHLAGKINRVRDTLIEVLAHIEAYIDFPEDDIEPATLSEIRQKLTAGVTELEQLVATAREGKVLREGVRVAIVGRPNAGKSSLLNALLGEERAIVTPVAGTTRDTVEEQASLNGIPVVLTDTAGIRAARGKLERLGVERSKQSAQHADLVLYVIDASKPLRQADLEILHKRSVLECIVVLNKSDLPKRAQLLGKLGGIPAVRVSCISGFGLDELRTMIGETALKAIPTEHQSVVVNERQKVLFQHAVKSLTGSIQLIDNQHWNDTIAQEIRNALHSVDEVVGKSFGEDVLDRIFSRFCIGK